MILERVRMSFDRGVAQNKPEDVGLGTAPTETTGGGKIRGLGTHYTSPEAEALAIRLGIEEGRVNREIARRFMRSPIEGLYVVSRKGEMREALAAINPDPGVNARVATYVLEAGDRNAEDVEDWIKTVKNQLKLAPLGRAKDASNEGLDIIKRLAECPVLSDDSRNELLSLVAAAKLGRVDRVEFKRKIVDMNLSMSMPVVVMPGAVVPSPAVASPEKPSELPSINNEPPAPAPSFVVQPVRRAAITLPDLGDGDEDNEEIG